MRTPQQLLAAVVVVALVAVQVRQSIRRGKPSVLLSESGRYWTGSTNDGVGYYADLVNNPSERPEEYLEKQRQDAAEAEEGAAARSRRTSLQQIFHLPDLEQETDGLDLMQDFAPGVTEMADGEVSEPAAPKAKGNDDESYAMHSLRNAYEAKSLASPQSLYQQPLTSLAWKSTPWKETWDIPGSKDLGRHVGIANGASEVLPAADSPFDSVGTADSYWPAVDGQKPRLNARVRAFVGGRFEQQRPFRAFEGAKLMDTSDEALPSATGLGYSDVPGRDGYEFRAVSAGPSDTYNYWQGAHFGDEKGPEGVYVGDKLGDIFDGLNPVVGE